MEYFWVSPSATSYEDSSWSKIAIELHLSICYEMVGMIIKMTIWTLTAFSERDCELEPC